MPDAPIRADALQSIARKRAHADGAALFWILPRRRHPRLPALLAGYQTIWDFLDNAGERGACMGERNGRLLHSALVQALDPHAPIGEHYRHHLCDDDGGYLRALIVACREACLELPSYNCVRAAVLAEAERCAIQSINHHPDPADRDTALRAWAAAHPLAGEQFGWFELTAAASASLVPHVLLALAAEPAYEPQEIAAVHAAYLPWVSLTTAMLDSYADLPEDAVAGAHSYIAHYRDGEEAVRRVGQIVEQAARATADLPQGHRHAIVLACVVAMYLSKDGARAAERCAGTQSLARSGGSLSRLLLPVLRVWRTAYGQRAA
jgi:tetraprenyl-beta-curcumene synthase